MKKTISVFFLPTFFFRHERKLGAKHIVWHPIFHSCSGEWTDHQLLKAAESGKILDESHLRQTFERMINDPKIQRFLDSFPSQWMQLKMHLQLLPTQNLAVSSPLIKITRQPHNGFGTLLYLMLFLENRSITDLISLLFPIKRIPENLVFTNELKPAEGFSKIPI
ncbi:MAG: hypothetical protein CM15mP130_1750 [Verrucomicrobiota bacterium]|nr:MAG: hypothetical protein CM15mP130_1750 [Verrucomicrobiota bacterium]